MKKLLIAAIILATALSLTACSGGAGNESKDSGASSKSESSSSSQSESSSSGAKDDSANGSQGVAYSAVYGKVSNITGNEMDMSLAKDPYADLAPEGGEGEAGAAITAMVPATEAGTAGSAEAPKMQLEYTDETKSYTIPAGVKITGKNGGEAQLDSIKKGSVLMMLTDKDVITEIVILE